LWSPTWTTKRELGFSLRYRTPNKCQRPDETLGYQAHPAKETNVEAWQTITNAKLLDELPVGAVIRESDGAVHEKKDSQTGPQWFQTGWSGGRTAEWMNLPALVLWHPAWVKT
jgi:hypothetical protein